MLLESEDIDKFPSGTYAIGFLRNYAEYLGVDVNQVVTLYRAKRIQNTPTPESLLQRQKRPYIKVIIIISIARYYTPSDTNIDKIGIPPDLEVLFPELTEQEEESYQKLMEDGVLSQKVTSADISEKEIAALADELYSKYPMEKSLLRRLIRLESDKYREPRLYDLDFDIQLHAALEVIKDENFAEKVAQSKTLKELQEEAELEMAETISSEEQ